MGNKIVKYAPVHGWHAVDLIFSINHHYNWAVMGYAYYLLTRWCLDRTRDIDARLETYRSFISCGVAMPDDNNTIKLIPTSRGGIPPLDGDKITLPPNFEDKLLRSVGVIRKFISLVIVRILFTMACHPRFIDKSVRVICGRKVRKIVCGMLLGGSIGLYRVVQSWEE